MTLFQTRRRVEFQHCDPAGLVFYPRYFEMVNSVIEEFFAEALGTDFRTLHMERGKAVPTVRIEAEFVRPSRLGDRLDFALSVERIGRTSAGLRLVGAASDEIRLAVRSTIVHIDGASGRPEPWPDDLRAGLAARAPQETRP